MNDYVITASFLGTAVEFIEALTIVLAVWTVKGWKSAVSGMALAVIVLTALVAIFGVSLVNLVNVMAFQIIVGILMLMFGIRWLRKAILRYSGLKALHLEDEAYNEELARQRKQMNGKKDFDIFGFTTVFNGVFLEGLESIFIVLTFGLAAHSLSSAVTGSIIGLVIVVLLGVLLRKPLTLIPENTMKFVVGVMLSSFGIFWVGEGVGVKWWHADISILIIIVALLVIAFGFISFMSVHKKNKVAQQSLSKTAGGGR